MRIAVDVDGVIADRIGSIVERINATYGLSLTYSDVDRYDFSVPDSDVDIHDVIEESTRDPDHLLGLDPVDGAVEGMQRLYDHHQLLIATHRPARIHEETRRWLRAHDVPYDRFVSECGPRKADLVADVLVDDRPANVRGFAENQGEGVLFSQPWNDGDEYGHAVTIVDDWTELGRVCDRYASTSSE